MLPESFFKDIIMPVDQKLFIENIKNVKICTFIKRH